MAMLQFTATVTGIPNQEVVWTATAGSIDAQGQFTAPPAKGRVRVRATSRAYPTASATAEIAVTSPPRPAVSVSISPSAASVQAGASLHFTATVSGAADSGVIWSVDEGTIDADGLYRAPSGPVTAHVKATSRADGTKSATTAVSVTPKPPVSVSVEPRTATVRAGGSLQLTASVTGASDTGVVWETNVGTVDSAGLFRAPAAAATALVKAISREEPGNWATATLTIEAPELSVSIEPTQASAVSMSPQTVQFVATVAGAAAPGVTWTIQEGIAGGTVDENGLYRPPQHQSATHRIHVVATSRQDPSKSAVAFVDLWGDLVDHGGGVVPNLRTFIVWWGPSSDFEADERSSLEDFLKGLNGSDYLALTDQYLRGAKASVSFGGSFEEPTAPPPGRPPMDDLLMVACGTIQEQGIAPGPSDLVVVASARETDDFSCGWHTWMVCGGNNVLLVYLPSRKFFCSDNTSICAGTNRSKEATSLVVTASHELFETITDPWFDAWYASGEISDKCGSRACVGLSTGTFGVSQVYSNAIHGCAPQ